MSLARKALAVLVFLGALAIPAGASAATAVWSIESLSAPTNFVPGDVSGLDRYQTFFTNNGGAAMDPAQGPITITDTLPVGLGVKDVGLQFSKGKGDLGEACEEKTTAEVTTVSCEVTEALLSKAEVQPGDGFALEIQVTVPSDVTGSLVNSVEVEGGGAARVSAHSENEASPADPPPGYEVFRAELTDEDGLPASGADSHPYQYTTSFGVNLVAAPPASTSPFVPAGGDLKEIEVTLPPGLAGNPTAIPRCRPQDFNSFHKVVAPIRDFFASPNDCPPGSVVGMATVQLLEGQLLYLRVPIYNLDPPPGMPAQLGFQVFGAPTYINTRLRSESDYGVSGFLHNVTEARRVTAARISLWGTPWEESHDPTRGQCLETWDTCHVEGTPRPFLRLPSSCENPLLSTMSFTTWAQPPASAIEGDEEEAPVGCAAPDFSPRIEARPTTNVADSPSGLHFRLALPQAAHEDPEGLGEADLREATVKLPPGLVVNPASADGLGACSPSEVGLVSAPGESPIRFSTAPAQCPNASKVGTVSARVPALDHPIAGSVYLARQFENPFNSLLALYIVLEDEESGVTVKLAGKVSADPVSGQLTTTVSESPQQPVEEFTFDLSQGARAPLRTPPKCATYTTTTRMTPWTAPEGKDATPTDSFAIGAGPQGPCPTGALDPKLAAGLAKPTAATYSPFSLRLTRPDGSGEFAAIEASPPSGVLAKLAGVPYCPESSIAQASGRSAPGQGALEAASPSCPAATQIGTTTGGVGAGPAPFYASGKVYLAGPYKGAPVSMVAVIPAVAGPFDLGTIVNRIALKIDPETVQVSAQSDPLPQILFGIPLDVRDIRVNLDRAGFTLAGTSCDPKQVTAQVTGVGGSSKTVSDRFQLGGCGALGFKPALSLALKGGTKRSAHPSLRAVLTYPKGSSYANTASASVALPHSEFLDQAHIRTICTRVQFAADACPKGSIYGKARAITPLLDKPLEGPVYLRSSSNPLPDLVMALHGQIDVVAVARIDSHNGGIRTSFEAVPDGPLTKVVLEMRGGKKGLLVNSRNICKHTNRATARFAAHNGRTYDSRPVLKDSCKGGKPHKSKPHKR